jgi:hypothetical protein
VKAATLLPQRQQEVRDRRRRVQAAPGEVVAPAERHDLPMAGIAVELERLERQGLERGDEIALLVRP